MSEREISMEINVGMCVTLDGIGILILMLLFFDFGAKPLRKKTTDDGFFRTIILINVILLLTDMLTWVLNGQTFLGARLLNTVSSCLYFLFQPIICLAWLLYCKYMLTEDLTLIKRRLPLYVIPLVFAAIGSVASGFTPFFFWVDQMNIYGRSKYYPLFFVLCFFYYLYSTFLVVRDMKIDNPGKNKKRNGLLLFYPIPSAIGAIVQTLFYGISVIWIGSVISLLIIYYNLQNEKVTTDPLTSLNNRKRFNNYLETTLQNTDGQHAYFLLILDINDFKNINDAFGHLVGDEALIQTAKILGKAVRPYDFIARIGGDEFAVIGKRPLQEDPSETMENIRQESENFNKSKITPYTLEMSIGSAMFFNGEGKTAEELIVQADNAMYQEKQRLKNTPNCNNNSLFDKKTEGKNICRSQKEETL